ncbi:hypothetical protein K504DRAFT_499435 [Pleomassaria siparia CBS 279.74]|uniref:Uncharacterized protein n=1 Tax=Pleomassaria siparia CBS 279.74 TaxID=1314801 RepID=A0A6G1KI81_9PLEO|nr:hypothetical protein K504DRAFT_499435 [Pleomassaria siparia CBS 279.74]
MCPLHRSARNPSLSSPSLAGSCIFSRANASTRFSKRQIQNCSSYPRTFDIAGLAKPKSPFLFLFTHWTLKGVAYFFGIADDDAFLTSQDKFRTTPRNHGGCTEYNISLRHRYPP